MKNLIVFAAFAVFAAYAFVTPEGTKLKEVQKECESKLVEPKNLLEKISSGEDIGDEVKAGDMALCINVKMGHMDLKGDLSADKFKAHVEKLTDDEQKRKELIDKCGVRNGDTAGEAALNYVKCMLKNVPIATA